jgi:hypothetical protein
VSPRRLTVPVLAATAALVILLALRPLSTSRALAIWVVLVAAMALLLLVRHSREGRGARTRFEAALRRAPAATPQPVELLRVERDLELGIAGAAHAHHRLLPILREAAAARLGSHHGIELERRPDAARELLGDDVWDLLRPDRPEPRDRFDPGVPRERIAAVIERVEAL